MAVTSQAVWFLLTDYLVIPLHRTPQSPRHCLYAAAAAASLVYPERHVGHSRENAEIRGNVGVDLDRCWRTGIPPIGSYSNP
jgi:hypothetical protein